ncbi:methionyl-tRNA formyltransferase [Kushneria phosphatilytica]|uniref:Methionyl-tRNA formyltransferase n=1 Tax=Kushneria phosphatilytica TaxID=657387 RepID=A0A1S1NM06_9GAMM|nr:methionyl-tRNA formyltransferase [Kushneria phosphatilytica]OHV07771.1 methionyl-tRNA formyltransferase [Kushneria phosphatilytica]QEL10275.1 methionyl-tRNA formyltransferase [Kushneria phosphatilytica]
MSRSLRVAFAGTPEFAAGHLNALLGSRHEVVLVLTQPDRPSGRGRQLTPSPVKSLALEHDLPLHQPERLKSEAERAPLIEANIDLLVVVAYGLILPRAVLDIPKLGAVNVHASLLPRWRGAAPIQRAIEARDERSGVTLMAMDEGLDTGDMLLVRETPLDEHTTAAALHDRLAELGCELLVEGLDRLADGNLVATPQPSEGVTYAAKISKAEAELDFSLPAEVLAARVRAFNPVPVAWTRLGEERLRIWEAVAEPRTATDSATAPGTLLAGPTDAMRIACGHGVLRVRIAQLPGGKPMPIEQLMHNRRHLHGAGMRLGSTS